MLSYGLNDELITYLLYVWTSISKHKQDSSANSLINFGKNDEQNIWFFHVTQPLSQPLTQPQLLAKSLLYTKSKM